MMDAITAEPGQSVCDKCEFTCAEYSNFKKTQCLRMDLMFDTFPILECTTLPRISMHCNKCNKSTGKFVAKVMNNRKECYVIQCNTCRSRWMMNVSAYEVKYSGYTNYNGDYVPPSKDGRIELPRHAKLQMERESRERRVKWGLPVENEPEYIWGGPKRGLVLNPMYKKVQ